MNTNVECKRTDMIKSEKLYTVFTFKFPYLCLMRLAKKDMKANVFLRLHSALLKRNY